MKVVLLVVGKTDNWWLKEAIDDYCKRLARYLPFEMVVVPNIKNAGRLPEVQQKEKEGELIMKHIQPGDCCVLLDEKGKEFTSAGFSVYLEKKTHTAPRRLVFVAGGPYGFSAPVYNASSERIALSKMTFSHQMVRLIFVEQLYRACSILNNEPYHHE
ncbi:MAG: 23S rRNA (pseudouridine(1915)-N(3))-methyltransferase RlmH [Tannerellaceae bacterium]|jgi:23S rRNA (pseudouridine1915-N3)-methyltransferase|nr:23S rRNA (pseudouridine(1915)-N(3))-methyltransferase RlmH [Tannerellaceae bacterium]